MSLGLSGFLLIRSNFTPLSFSLCLSIQMKKKNRPQYPNEFSGIQADLSRLRVWELPRKGPFGTLEIPAITERLRGPFGGISLKP